MSDAQRRTRIVSEAEKLFIQKGYGATSTEEIAAQCKMSKQTLYRLFSGKLNLFAAVVESNKLRMIDLGDGYDCLPLGEALRRIFMVDLDQEAYETRASFLRVSQTEAAQYPELLDVLKRHGGEKTFSQLNTWLARQCQTRGLRIKNTSSAAHMLMDMFTGAVVFDAIGGFGWAGPEERIAHFSQCIAIFLHGTAPLTPGG